MSGKQGQSPESVVKEIRRQIPGDNIQFRHRPAPLRVIHMTWEVHSEAGDGD